MSARDRHNNRWAALYLIGLMILVALGPKTDINVLVFALVGKFCWRRSATLRGWLAGRRASIQTHPPASTRLGRTVDGHVAYLTDSQLAAHGLILGATGSGKTTSLLTILCDQITRGAPVIAIDLKGSDSFAQQLDAAATASGRKLRTWRPEGPCHWNPLAYGDRTELKDKLFGAEKFTEPHYQRAGERYLQTTLELLHTVHPNRPVTLAEVVAALDPSRLRRLLTRCPKEMISRIGPYITNLSRDQQSAVLGLQSRLAVLSESVVGQYLEPGANELDVRHALAGGNEVLLFSLNSGRYGKLSGQIAAMIVQDLIAAAGHRLSQTSRPLAIVAIDEFSALDADNLLNLLARSRESGISVLLSTQELADLERLAAGFRDQVLGNTGLLLAHRQNVPASAELVAQMIGTCSVWQQTYQTEHVPKLFGGGSKTIFTGVGTSKQVEEFRIHPNVIKGLGTGQAVLLTRTPSTTASLVEVKPWQPE